MKLFPRSLGGQMAVLLGLALLVAQLANFALILNERQKLSLAENQGPAIVRFAGTAADLDQAAPEFRSAVIADASHRGARFAYQKDSGIADADRDRDLEARLRSGLGDVGLVAKDVRATVAKPQGRGGRQRDVQVIRLAFVGKTSQWLTASLYVPKRDPWLAVRLGAATLLLYLLVLGATIWIAMRIARPLRSLTLAASAFGGRTVSVAVTPSGPADLRQAIEAFNAMNRRVEALLDEKDRMLGAIGHDLRTPLASLRIRVESMEPDEEREAAIAKIAEMTAMLEDILVLARTGRAREDLRPVDVAALADSVVEELRDLGQQVSFIDSSRAIVRAQPDLLRRALRNLIENAIVYGGGAEVSVGQGAGGTYIRVVDHGPGIPPDQFDQVLQPFYRLEKSRNRATGGSGLGLAIAGSIAANHGGRLVLSTTDPHGLTAELLLP
ncbi:ATP-binding protein [Sphingomonas sp. MMS24-J13]|uniref:HAMP domain-containing sensor histidine kinase n=1 Tax=Sphingomonas sp. MMS24-J13 TaxID=3238686 RepID=UPI00384E5AE9